MSKKIIYYANSLIYWFTLITFCGFITASVLFLLFGSKKIEQKNKEIRIKISNFEVLE